MRFTARMQAIWIIGLGFVAFCCATFGQQPSSVCTSGGRDIPIVATVTQLGNVRIECHAQSGFPATFTAQVVRLAPNWRNDPRPLLDLRQQIGPPMNVQSAACPNEADLPGHESRYRWICLDASQKFNVKQAQEALMVLTAPGRKETVSFLSTDPSNITVKDAAFSGLSGMQLDVESKFQLANTAMNSRPVKVHDESSAYQEFVPAGTSQASGEHASCPPDAPVIPDDTGTKRAGCRMIAGVKSYDAIARFNPNDPGKIKILLPRRIFRNETAQITIEGLDVPVKGQVVIGAPSKEVSNSDFYVKLLHTASKGAKPGLGIDGKLSHTFNLSPSFELAPEADANVGIRDQDFGNSVTFLANLRYSHLDPFAEQQFFPGYRLVAAPKFETDKEFDRGNLLGRFEFSPIISRLYLTREIRTQEKAKRAGLDATAVRPAQYGRGLQLFFAVEAGGSLLDVKEISSNMSSTLIVPTYSIVRLAPQLTGFLEFGRVSVTVDSTFRFLLNEELSSIENSNGTLFLRKLSGFRPLSKGTLEWAFDPAKHVSVVLTYTNGYETPKFDHQNKVQTGVAFRY